MAKNTETVAENVPAQAPEHHFVVVHPFGDYRRGDLISDADAIAEVHAGENKHHGHKVKPQ